jgi:arsenate reductase
MTHSPRKTKVLFVCIGNMCRSPMAEGYARKFGGDILEAYSAGTHATGVVSEDAIEIMGEVGIDITHVASKGLDAVAVGEMDVVVSMAPARAAALVPRGFGGRTIDWKVEDPVGKSLAVFRRVQRQLEVLVKRLVDDIRRERGRAA